MDSQQQIIKAHKALLASLTPEESAIFSQLTTQHQLFLVGFLVCREKGDFPDDKTPEDVINGDIEDCIEHIKENILKINTIAEAGEIWENWLRLKSETREIMELLQIARLLFIPHDIKLSHEKRIVMHETAANILAGFWATEEYLTPYFYPWQTAYKRLLFKGSKLPDFSESGDRGRRMFFTELPIDKKVYACIHIDDLECASKRLPKGGRLHLEKIFDVWKSYLDIENVTEVEKRSETQDRIAKWNNELENLWKTGKYRKHIAACRDIADKYIRETGDIITPEHIADETRTTYRKLKPRKTKQVSD